MIIGVQQVTENNGVSLSINSLFNSYALRHLRPRWSDWGSCDQLAAKIARKLRGATSEDAAYSQRWTHQSP